MALRTLTLGSCCCFAVVQGASCTSSSDAEACDGDEEASLLQKGAQVGLQQQEQAADEEFGPLPPGGWGRERWWKKQDVSVIFYRPHFKCAGNPTGTRHVRTWMESVMDGTTNGKGEALPKPDFVGFSEMQSTEGIPGGDRKGYGDYDLISSVCGKHRDPIALYYRKTDWKLLKSFPPSEECQQYSPWPLKNASNVNFQCPNGTTAPSEGGACCACTYSQEFADSTLYGDAEIVWPKGPNSVNMGEVTRGRPFVIGKFEHTESKRKVCAVTFNLPHQFLTNCTNQLDATCLTNAAANAYRIGTAQLVNEINEVCEQTPLLFFGDTNNGASDYDTSYMFFNPYNPEVAESAEPCRQPAPLLSLRDPVSAIGIPGQPYTCCKEEPMFEYASDRIAASGPSWSSVAGFFKPQHLLGGARQAGAPIAEPLSVGIEASCDNVETRDLGLPCCGDSPSEHAPVWGFFQLFR